MPATYEPIATTTLGSTASSITFSSIPSTYTDLRLVLVCQATANDNDGIRLRPNSDAGNNYSYTRIMGDGTSASSSRATTQDHLLCGYLAPASLSNRLSLTTIDIFSYAGSVYKTILATCSNDQNAGGAGYSNTVIDTVGLWRQTTAISSLNLTPSAGSFASGATATLYGIKAA